MRKAILFALILLTGFIMNSCCLEDIIGNLKDSFEFTITDQKGKPKDCSTNGEEIIIKFEFLKNLPPDIIKEYTMAEIKNCIISKLVPIADMHLVVRQYDKIIDEISLNYKNSESNFEKQVKEIPENDPWLFKVPYTIPMDVKEGLTAMIRIKYTEDDKAKYIYSQELAIPICSTPPPAEPEPEQEIEHKVTTLPTVSGYENIYVNIRLARKSELDNGETASISGVDITSKDMIEITSSGRILFDNAKFTIPALMSESSNASRSFENDVVRSLVDVIRRVKGKYHYILIQGSADGNVRNSNAIIRSFNSFDQKENEIYRQPIAYILKTGNHLSTRPYDYRLSPGGVSNNDLPNLRAAFIKDVLSNYSGIGIEAGIPIGIINGEVIPGENVYNRTVAIYILETDKPLFSKDDYNFRSMFD